MKLNPNQLIVDKINKRLEITDGFCPCVPDSINNEDYKCPCKKSREESKCCCRLFVKED